MTWRLLFDQNLAPRLVDRVAAEFPGSLHVRDVDLQAATDAEVLRVAAERDLVIVTKDKDFADIVAGIQAGDPATHRREGASEAFATRARPAP